MADLSTDLGMKTKDSVDHSGMLCLIVPKDRSVQGMESD